MPKRPPHLTKGSWTAYWKSRVVVLNLYWSTDACVFSLGNVNICIPNLSLQLFSYLTDLSNVVKDHKLKAGAWAGSLCIPQQEAYNFRVSFASLLVAEVHIQLFANILKFRGPCSAFPSLQERLDVPTLHSHKHQTTIDLQHLPPRWLISFTNESGCQRPQIIAVSTFQKHILIWQQN